MSKKIFENPPHLSWPTVQPGHFGTCFFILRDLRFNLFEGGEGNLGSLYVQHLTRCPWRRNITNRWLYLLEKNGVFDVPLYDAADAPSLPNALLKELPFLVMVSYFSLVILEPLDTAPCVAYCALLGLYITVLQLFTHTLELQSVLSLKHFVHEQFA